MATRSSDPPTEITLPITPMLDMTFQLMFFFLATFNPSPVREGQMSLTLPVKSDEKAHSLEQVTPLSRVVREEIEDKAIVTINLRAYKDPLNRGLISYMTINTDNANNEELKGTPDEREQMLMERLEKAKSVDSKDGKRPKPTVRMAAERDVRWSQVMKIMDVCYKTGYQVSFIEPNHPGDGG